MAWVIRKRPQPSALARTRQLGSPSDFSPSRISSWSSRTRNDNTPYDEQLAFLDDRIKNLEDIIIPPGGPSLGERLAALGDKINEAKMAIQTELKDLDARKTKEIEEDYEIVAELQNIVAALQKQVGRGRTMEA